MEQIPEKDWKIFKPLYELALNRFYERILRETVILASNEAKSFQERYMEVFKHIRIRDKALAQDFSHFSRSNALLDIVFYKRQKLITDEEFARFSEETQAYVNQFFGHERHLVEPDDE